MFVPVKVIDVELSRPLANIEGLRGYGSLQVLVRLHGRPLGYVRLALNDGFCSATALREAVLAHHGWPVFLHLLGDAAQQPSPPPMATASSRVGWSLAELLNGAHPPAAGRQQQELPPPPLVTVAVCTRDRTADLAQCLDALARLDYPALELLVIDNAPRDDATARLVRARYPHVRYACEPRPGLDWARNRAIREARGEILAYTDDDVLVDPQWVAALAAVFAENPDVMAVTGLVVPYELETEAQMLFEQHSGFGRGFKRIWCRVDYERGESAGKHYGGTGILGTGANMAYRRRVFDQIGLFDPALGAGTPTRGGDDVEMFFRVLKEGHTVVYEPSAMVRHRHRRDYAQLRRQLMDAGIGCYAYYIRSAVVYPEERLAFLRWGLWWFWWWSIRRLLTSFVRPSVFPRDLILAEMYGALIGLGSYQKARRAAAQIARSATAASASPPG